MDCCKFKDQMTRIIPSFAGFTAFAPAIPKMYWDVKSQEQRIFGLCKMLNKVICYADMLGENVDEIAKTLQDIEDGKLDDIITAAVAEWFEEHQEEIFEDITALQEAVEALQEDVGEIDKELAKVLSNPTLTVHSRIALPWDAAQDKGLQGGCAFKINQHVFCAEWLATDDDQYTDDLIIIDMNSNTQVATMQIAAGHGMPPTYNPNTQELAFCAGGSIYFVDVSNPNAPTISHSFETPNIETYGKPNVIAWDDENYDSFYVLKHNSDLTDMILLHTSVDFQTLYDVIELDITDYQTYTYQSIDVKNGICYFTRSSPECVVMCDVKTGERLNVVPIPDFIDFLPIREIEWACVLDGVLYCAQANMYPGYICPVTFKWDMKHGTVTHEHYYWRHSGTPERLNAQYVIANWEDADLVNPFAMGGARPRFKFVEDCVNYAKHYNLNIYLSFEGDYPSFANITNLNFTLAPLENVEVGGLSIYQCVMYGYSLDRITFNGKGSDASGLIHTNTYLHAVRIQSCFLALDSIWSVTDGISSGKQLSLGSFVQDFISAYAVSKWSDTTPGQEFTSAFSGCAIIAKRAGHENVVNQSNTVWLADLTS